MMLAGFLFLLLLTGGSALNDSELLGDQLKSNYSIEESGSTSNYSKQSTDEYEFSNQTTKVDKNSSCTHRDVLKHLNLTRFQKNSLTRPGIHSSPTKVQLDVLLYAILDVNEKDQKFVSYIWVDKLWQDEDISWNSSDFCNIYSIYIPTEAVWKPDLTIEEMTEKEKASENPYLHVNYQGYIILRNNLVVVSNCRMQVYKFPFDVQSCNLSFKSTIQSVDNIKLDLLGSSAWNTELSRKRMTQSEWVFINMTTEQKDVDNFGFKQSMIVYTINMKRRSDLYIANFLLPVLFFLCLDLFSFLISDCCGEKLGYKVTVLLAVTVMQLILKDILPSSSEKIPLIAIYCIGIFGLMMLSLLETMLVMHLMEKDAAAQENKADKDQSRTEDCGGKEGKAKCCRGSKKFVEKICCPCVCGVSTDEPSSELLSVTKESNSSQLMEESNDLGKVSDELKVIEETLSVVLNSEKEERKPGYWMRVAKTINMVFFILYVTAVIVFLVVLFTLWNVAEND